MVTFSGPSNIASHNLLKVKGTLHIKKKNKFLYIFLLQSMVPQNNNKLFSIYQIIQNLWYSIHIVSLKLKDKVLEAETSYYVTKLSQ